MIYVPKLKLIGNTIQLTYSTISMPLRYSRAATHDSESMPPNARLGFIDGSPSVRSYLKDGFLTFDVPQGTSLEDVYCEVH